jgi:hypothetical protein
VSSGTIDYHGALAPLREACRISTADILWVEDLLRAPPSCGTLLRKCAVAIRHLYFVPSVWRLKKDQHMLIREFSNIPLALIFLLILPWREKLFFLVNHNLQWTVACPAEMMAFRLLGRMGCRFVFFEQIPEEPLRRLGINLKKCFSIPHPVPETGRFRARSGGIKKVGVIGQFRAEKGIDDLLQHLEALSPDYDITVGLPNGAEFKKHSKFAAGTWFELKDTSRPDAYRNTLSECDVIVLNHPASSYQFRASGLRVSGSFLCTSESAQDAASVVERFATLGVKRLAFNRFNLGEDFCRDALGLSPETMAVPGFDLLAGLGFTREHFVAALAIAFLVYAGAVAFSLPGALVLSLTMGFIFGRWLGTVLVVLVQGVLRPLHVPCSAAQ